MSNKYEVDSKVLEKPSRILGFLKRLKRNTRAGRARRKTAEQGSGNGGGSSPSRGSSSSKGGSSVGFVPTPVTEDISIVKEEIFKDLENFDWAKEHIMALLQQRRCGRHREKNTFSPSNLVTREQFVKMISALTAFDENSPSAEFSDVAKGEWYEKYINGAKASGLISGRDDGTFGVGDCIIRQDAAIMCLNAIKKERPDLLENLKIEKNFRSATQAIFRRMRYTRCRPLTSSAFLNGDASGNFNANANATRAEAAVMINKVMTLIGEGAEKNEKKHIFK
ncbi:MAG: S-layer homology domain-containing protein [Clostridiales bacterium]|nr:MAG: S-layer homology domain-containing protein [Clostridiales bacterium]